MSYCYSVMFNLGLYFQTLDLTKTTVLLNLNLNVLVISANILFILVIFCIKSSIKMAKGYLARKKNSQGKFSNVLILPSHNYKIVFKVRISSPLQSLLLVDGSNRKETNPVWKFSLWNFSLQDVTVLKNNLYRCWPDQLYSIKFIRG